MTKIEPSFPRFQNLDQVDDYLSGEDIVCLECKRALKTLTGTHLIHKHGLTPDEYRERYGIPWKRPLCGREVSAKLSERWYENKETQLANLERGKHNVGRNHRKRCPAVIAELSMRMKTHRTDRRGMPVSPETRAKLAAAARLRWGKGARRGGLS